MKPKAFLLVVALAACGGESVPPTDQASGGQPPAGHGGGGSSGAAGLGGSPTGSSGASGGQAPNGGAPASGATASEAGTHSSGGGLGTGGDPIASGGSAAGDAGGPAEAGSGGTSGGSGGAPGDAGAGGADLPIEGGPCDIYAAGNTPCAAAYSTVRALLDAYDGPLYQVRRSDGETADIGLLAPGGFANAAAQDEFCGTAACTISVMYDQSGSGNHLTRAPPDCYGATDDPSNESDAKGRSLIVGGHQVYALQMVERDGYRANDTTGMPTGDDAQGIYEVVDGSRVGTTCCWDFGNGSTNNCPHGSGTANALFFGTAYWGAGAGDGPWFMADFENGVWAGGAEAASQKNPELPSIRSKFAFGSLKTGSASYTLRVGNAGSGVLTTGYDGPAPYTFAMQGGVVLGLSSDASNASFGTFFEGAITRGRPSDEVDDAVLKNVQAAGYEK
jgi:non-reducing end alpha-L-arabinofuranosidase